MAGIIKAGGSQELRSGESPIAYRFDDISERAIQYLDNAKQQAAEIVDKAKADAARIERRAEVQGQEQAYAQAKQALSSELHQHLETVLPAIETAVGELQQMRVSWHNRWEKNAVRLAVAIASRIVRREVAQHPEIAQDLLHEALDLAAGSDQVVVRLHPADFAALEGSLDEIRSRFQGIGEIAFVADPEIQLGSCRLATDYGSVDQQFEAQLQRIQEELNE